jgi:HlyD family secretion protein
VNKKLLIVPIVLVAVAAGVWWSKREHAGNGNELVLHGNIDIREVSLAFNASGRIDQILVKEGDAVSKGQHLATLDTERLRLSLAEAQNKADALRSNLAKLKAGSRPEEIRQAAAERDAAKATADDARQVYQRTVDLVAKHFVSQQQADSAKNALDAADQREKAAEQAYRLAVLGPRKEDISAAAASLAAQDAVIAGLKYDISQGKLDAPDNGVIENRILEPGDMASPQNAVFTIALTDPVWARVYLPETALGRIPMGARATITNDSHPGRKYRGWVGYVSPTAEFTPKTVETQEVRTSLVYETRVFVCNGKSELRQGMPVTVTITYDQKTAGSTAPPCDEAHQ